jgi:hypothetical protein
MVSIKTGCLIVGFVFFFQRVICQELVRGIVVDSATFEALPYVNIQVKNSLRGTTTDLKGNFSIGAKDTDTLVFTLLGYKKIELSLADYEAGIIRMSEYLTYLRPVVIRDSLIFENPYAGMFDEQNAKLIKRIPFYYHKARKDKIKAANWREESQRVQTYVDVVINDPETKLNLITQYKLTEQEYYQLLSEFNEKNYSVMYYLTKAELLSFINRFFESHRPLKK